MADQTTGLTDAQVMGDPSQQLQAPAPPQAQRPVVWADTGLPVVDAAFAAQARANGDASGPSGSPTNPMYMRENETPPPGATYIDSSGTHVAPGTFQAPAAAPPPPPAAPAAPSSAPADSAPASGLSDDQVLGAPEDRATVSTAAPAGPPVSVGSDVLHTILPSLARGAAGFAGQIGDAANMFGNAIDAAQVAGGNAINHVLGRDTPDLTFTPSDYAHSGPLDAVGIHLPTTSGDYRSLIEKATGPLYQPQTEPGRMVNAGGEFLPNAVMGEGGVLRRAAQVVFPSLASQGSGDAVRAMGGGPVSQAIASTLGGLAGGGAASVRALRPSMLPAADQGAADAVNAALKISGTDPASLDPSRIPMATDPGLAALAQHVANTTGAGRTIIRDAAGTQMGGEGGRVMDSIARLGVHPRAANGDISDIVSAGQADVAPGWAALRADPTPVWNPQLEALSKRDVIKRAMKTVASNLGNSGKDPYALGTTFMDDPGNNAWEAPMRPDLQDAPPAALAARVAASAPKKAPAPVSLVKFMADNGGINDEGGEVSNMDGNLWHENKPFQSKLINGSGDGPDRWAERAADAGYFPPGSTPGPRELFDAMGQELGGRPIYPNLGSKASAAKRAAEDAADQQAYHAANFAPDDFGPDAYGQAQMPQSSPVSMVQPTAALWDKVRRAINGQIERNPFTKQPLSDDEAPGNEGVRNAHADLTTALAGDENGNGAAVPSLRDLLTRSADYKSVKGAYDRASGTLFNGPVSDFNDLWGSLKTDADRHGARAGLMNDVLNQFNRGLLKGGSFKTPGVQQKLKTAFGPAAQPFIDDMEREASERAELGGITGNSSTAYRQSLDKHFTPPKKMGVADMLQWGGAGLAAMAGHHEPLIVKSMLAMEHAVRPAQVKPWEDAATSARLGELLSSAPKMKAFLGTAAASKAAQTAAAQARVRRLQMSPILSAPLIGSVAGGQQQ